MKTVSFSLRSLFRAARPERAAGLLLPVMLLCGALLVPGAVRADPLAEVAAFSSLPKIDMAPLEKGEVISKHSPGMNGFSRGQSVESIFVVNASLDKTVEALREWNGSVHPDLKVYLHGDIGGAPGPADFKKLGSAPNNESVRTIVAATEKLAAGQSDLQVSSEEAQGAPAKASARTGIPPEMVTFWSGLLDKRVHAFLSGGVPALPPYTVSGQKISAADELSSLLGAAPKLRNQFRGIIQTSGVSGKPTGKPSLYWELLDGEGQSAISLGASFINSNPKGAQSVDLQYYATGNYYVFLTLYQAWPLDGPKPQTLVWRGDLVSSSAFGGLKGIERSAAGSALSKELERLINYFKKDAAH